MRNTIELNETIATATRVMNASAFNFASIWETKTRKSTSLGFNFDAKPIGFTTKEKGVVRTVIQIINA